MSDFLTLAAQRAVMRLKRGLRLVSPTEFGSVPRTDSEVLAGVGMPDEWQVMEEQGFVQDDTGLRLKPLIVYPGVILADHVTKPMKPPANAGLWLRINHRLQGNAQGGWSGAVSGASAYLSWDNPNATKRNTIWPGSKEDTLPPGGTFTWHYLLGTTDAAGAFTMDAAPFGGCGMISPPY